MSIQFIGHEQRNEFRRSSLLVSAAPVFCAICFFASTPDRAQFIGPYYKLKFMVLRSWQKLLDQPVQVEYRQQYGDDDKPNDDAHPYNQCGFKDGKKNGEPSLDIFLVKFRGGI